MRRDAEIAELELGRVGGDQHAAEPPRGVEAGHQQAVRADPAEHAGGLGRLLAVGAGRHDEHDVGVERAQELVELAHLVGVERVDAAGVDQRQGVALGQVRGVQRVGQGFAVERGLQVEVEDAGERRELVDAAGAHRVGGDDVDRPVGEHRARRQLGDRHGLARARRPDQGEGT